MRPGIAEVQEKHSAVRRLHQENKVSLGNDRVRYNTVYAVSFLLVPLRL